MGKRSQIKSDEVIDDSDDTGDDAPAPAAKKAKKEARQPAASTSKQDDAPAEGLMTTDEGEVYAPLTKMKRVTVRSYRKNVLIDLREFYTDSKTNTDKPGKKGLALSVDDWAKLKALIPLIDAEVAKQS